MDTKVCIFRFNPPAPGGPCKRCRRCPCTPKYWKIEVEAFATYTDSSAVLGYTEYQESANCYWGQLFDIDQRTGEVREKPATDYFADQTDWVLGTYASMNWGPTSLDPNRVFDEWVLFHVSRTTSGAGSAAYTRRPFLYQELEPDFGFFDCLGPNRFWYAGSFGDQTGEDPDFNGWPQSLLITPYYP